MEHLDDDKLQRYYDGELTEGEAGVVRVAVEASELEQARIGQLERLSALMAYAEDAADEVDAKDLFASIEEGIAATPNPRLQLINGARRKQQVGAAAAVGLAIAAAALLVFALRGPAPAPQVAETAERTNSETTAREPEAVPHAPGGSHVVEVEFGASTGTVFEVPGDDGQPLAVVWIDDAEEDT